MKPGDPSVISEWLARSQKVPLTVIAELNDPHEHPPCRYTDDATATLNDCDDVEVCLRHQAVLSLDKLLPHGSRIRDLTICLYSSHPDWDEEDHDGVPRLLYHHFFTNTLPNLERLDFRAAHVEQTKYVIPIPGGLFSGGLPLLKELKYLGVTGGLTRAVKNLTSCEIGYWSGSAGPVELHSEQLQVFLNNNKTVKSLTINECEPFGYGPWAHVATPMEDLTFLSISCFSSGDFEIIFKFIHAPQFKDLDTVHLSLSSEIQVVSTDSSGRTFQFEWYDGEEVRFQPLLHFGAVITTLRLDQRIILMQFNRHPALLDFFRSLNAVQVLEFCGTIVDYVQDALSAAGIFPGLKVIRVAVSGEDCRRTLHLLATASRRRMEEGNPLTAIEPLLAEGEDGLDQSLHVEWEESYKAENIQCFLSK